MSSYVLICPYIYIYTYTYTIGSNTHLLRNILSNYWCGMHRTCKKHSSKPDRKWWMTRREKQCRRILPLKLQQRSGQRVQQLKTICRYTTGRPQLLPLQWHSFVGQGSHWRPCPPAFVGKSNEKAKKAMSNWKTIEAHHQASKKFYIFSDGPHTHTHPPAGGWDNKVPAMRWKWRGREMKMRWRWQWDESYLTRTQRGESKRRGKEQTPTHET